MTNKQTKNKAKQHMLASNTRTPNVDLKKRANNAKTDLPKTYLQTKQLHIKKTNQKTNKKKFRERGYRYNIYI